MSLGLTVVARTLMSGYSKNEGAVVKWIERSPRDQEIAVSNRPIHFWWTQVQLDRDLNYCYIYFVID